MSPDPLSPYYVPAYLRSRVCDPLYDPYYRYPVYADRVWDPVLSRYSAPYDPVLDSRYWDPIARRYTYDPLLPLPSSRYWDPVLLRHRSYDPLLDGPGPLPLYSTSRDQLPINSPDRSFSRSYGK